MKGQHKHENRGFYIKKSPFSKSLRYNGIILDRVSKVFIGLAIVLFIATLTIASAHRFDTTSAAQCTTNPCNTTFSVNVEEALSVSVEVPSTWASGTPTYDQSSGTWSTDFLRNKVSVSVTSNNAQGFRASMYAAGTSLTNNSRSTFTIPTLASATTRGSFPVNRWGYSLNDTEAGDTSSTYNALTNINSPITIMSSTTATSSSRDIYFGTRADLTQASGTYTGTVVINVVTGSPDTEPIIPDNPVTPADDTPNDNIATYDATNNRTVYTTTTSSATTTTTTTLISDGDTTNTYQRPAGVTEGSNTMSNIDGSMPLATGLAVAASVAAASGVFFFIVAKRKKDDEEEEEEEY